MISRRDILSRLGLGSLAGALATFSRHGRAEDQSGGHHEHHATASASPSGAAETPVAPPIADASRGWIPVRTLNGWTLPFRMNDGVKEFHLVAEEVEHEFAPGSRARCWGYNGSTPGPTIEAVEGDRVRIFVTNCLDRKSVV